MIRATLFRRMSCRNGDTGAMPGRCSVGNSIDGNADSQAHNTSKRPENIADMLLWAADDPTWTMLLLGY